MDSSSLLHHHFIANIQHGWPMPRCHSGRIIEQSSVGWLLGEKGDGGRMVRRIFLYFCRPENSDRCSGALQGAGVSA